MITFAALPPRSAVFPVAAYLPTKFPAALFSSLPAVVRDVPTLARESVNPDRFTINSYYAFNQLGNNSWEIYINTDSQEAYEPVQDDLSFEELLDLFRAMQEYYA